MIPIVFHAVSPCFPGVGLLAVFLCVCVHVHVLITSPAFSLNCILHISNYLIDICICTCNRSSNSTLLKLHCLNSLSTSHDLILLSFLVWSLTLPHHTFGVIMSFFFSFKTALCHETLINNFSIHGFFHSKISCTKFPDFF